jgi:hypothetical protein
VTDTDDRRKVVERLTALRARVEIVTAGKKRRVDASVDARLAALRARVEAMR